MSHDNNGTDPVHENPDLGRNSGHASPSGKAPEAQTPRPAASGTSGSTSRNPSSRREDLATDSLPDVPNTSAVCPADATANPNGDSALQVDANVIRGTIRVGPMTRPRETFTVFTHPRLEELLLQVQVSPDAIIVADEDAEITVVDLDTHHWLSPPPHEELAAHAGSIIRIPDAWWVTHGGGLKLIYIGPHHEDRALAAAFSTPRSFTVELLDQTRHPQASSSKHGNARCGPVTFPQSDPLAMFDFRSVGILSPQARSDALTRMGLEEGRRYDHIRCPIDPAADSDARNCVVVLETGIFCHRCAHRDVQLRSGLPAGFFPFVGADGGSLTELQTMARHRVHWAHASLVLKHRFSNLSASILRRGYQRILEAHFDPGDPRIRLVFDPALAFVRGEGGWLDARQFEPTILDNDAAAHLPYTLDVVLAKNGEMTVRTNRARRAEAKLRTPQGYVSIRPIRGIDFGSDETIVPVHAPPPPRHVIRLLDDPMPLEAAWVILEQSFPLISRQYLLASIAAGICGQVKRCQPPMLIATGPSGSAKEQTMRLAASFLGQDIEKLPLVADEDKFTHRLGIALSKGNTFLVFDELGKTPDLAAKLKLILSISNTVTWRPLYTNQHVHSPFRAALFFPCVRFPDFLATSQEFLRRTRRVQLHRRVPNWGATSGGDTVEWRDRTPENANVANSILTHVWRLCHEHNFLFL